MIDFLLISTRPAKKDVIEIYPKFIIKKSKDLMIRGGDFYAIWLEDRGLWSTDEQDAIDLIDRELQTYAENYRSKLADDSTRVRVLYLWDAENGMIDAWHRYCQSRMRDNFKPLDEKLIFSNTQTTRQDYASKRLSYPLEAGSITAWDKLISTLYSPEERHKIEWAIGAIVSGDAKWIQKFMVLYGSAGTGKSTILNIIQKLFDGYYSVFDAKALGSSSNAFALEAFKKNPLVGIQHDGDLSKIEDNTRLNSLVSHELMTVNEKFKSTYDNAFKCFLFMGTNKPVKITDAKSGLIRRLIDVTPSGNKLDPREYRTVTSQVDFELGAIAQHCLDVYLEDPGYYDDYVPFTMMGASNDFYNFVADSYYVFKNGDGTTLRAAWEMYKTYCDEAKVPYPFSQRSFKEELKNYFYEYEDVIDDDGGRVRGRYVGFRTERFELRRQPKAEPERATCPTWLNLDATESVFDRMRADCVAQYASSKEKPLKCWDKVTTKLSSLDTRKLHFVKVPENHIVIDFDLKDENGNKCQALNIEAASKWPATYAELSKSGQGVHLHYIYTGDPARLSRIYDTNIEVKAYTGNSSLRRKLTKCNDLQVATISAGLPLKGEAPMVDFDAIKNEKHLRTMIMKNLNKECHADTSSSVNFIHHLLDKAYTSGMSYDVSDLHGAILAFAANATNQADRCVKLVSKMKFKSEEPSENVENEDKPIVFYDVEVFPNLFLVNWKVQGEGRPVIRMINPGPSDIEDLIRFRLVGFNCRRYDNHILYARLMGYTNEELYKLSQAIIAGNRNAFFGEAYNLSYTDVYDFATKKQSLKKWEIELGIHHKELGLPWDKPVPEERWVEVAEYCDNDVLATEAVFNARHADFMARKIQVELVKLIHGITDVSVNDTTNALSTKIIFGRNRRPQNVFNYRNLAEPVGSDRYDEYREKFGPDYKFRVFNADGLPVFRDYIPGEELPEGWSILPFFKGYKYEAGKSIFMGHEIGEGGRVYSNPGMYGPTWDGDVASMHPHSVIFECLFGPEFTKRFEEVVYGRVAIKHRDFEAAANMLEGALKPYLNEEFAEGLAQALKIVVNSIYGLTSAAFENPFRDPRNFDNIVAKRGALFMELLRNEVEKRGFVVAHIKTDSIKIPNANPEIIQFVCDFGKEYGYAFETEANFDRFCLVNDAVYIAKFADGKKAGKWTATGKQFAVPYVFKTLFSHEPIEFADLCEAKEVKTALYLDKNDGLPEDEHNYIFIGKVGSFCPIKPGCGGGELFRIGTDKDGNDKYSSATGAKGYRWLEAEIVKEFGKQNDIDRSYYDKLVNDAVATISQFGDFEQFTADAPYIDFPLEDDLPYYNDEELAALLDDGDIFMKR